MEDFRNLEDEVLIKLLQEGKLNIYEISIKLSNLSSDEKKEFDERFLKMGFEELKKLGLEEMIEYLSIGGDIYS